MGLSRGEAAAVLSLINAHHGNAVWNDIQLEAFHSELLPSMTVVEAREAVRRFYADNSTGRWMGSGDVNAIVRSMHNQSKPSEAQIGRECEKLGLDGLQSWMYRRQRMLGKPADEAGRIAVDYRPQLEAPKRKQRPRPGVGFNPNLGISLNDVIGDGRGQ